MTTRGAVLGCLVLVASALAISRRSLMISAILCLMALGFLLAGSLVWLRT